MQNQAIIFILSSCTFLLSGNSFGSNSFGYSNRAQPPICKLSTARWASITNPSKNNTEWQFQLGDYTISLTVTDEIGTNKYYPAVFQEGRVSKDGNQICSFKLDGQGRTPGGVLHGVIASHQLYITKNNVFGDQISVLDLESCKITPLPFPRTEAEFSGDSLISHAECNSAGQGNMCSCHKAQVFKFDQTNCKLEIDPNESSLLTEEEIGTSDPQNPMKCPEKNFGMSIPKLFKIIDDKKLSTLDDVLPLLGNSLLSNFTLQYQGHGLQEASYESPRAILFGQNGRFITTFNGDSSEAKFRSLEVMQFNDQKKSFELYEIEFPIKRDSNGLAVRPQLNPSACTKCHGADPHPFWDEYANWNGFYGSQDDYLNLKESDATITIKEYKELLSYKQKRNTNSRYKWLQFAEDSVSAPYRTEDSVVIGYEVRPNLRMGMLLATLNAQRLYRIIKESPNYSKYGLLLGMWERCIFYEDYNQPTSNDWTDDDQKKMDELVLSEFKKMGIKFPYPKLKTQNLANLIALFGMKNNDWNMSLQNHDQVKFNADNNSVEVNQFVFKELWPLIKDKIPALESYYREFPMSSNVNYYHVDSISSLNFARLIEKNGMGAETRKPGSYGSGMSSPYWAPYGCDLMAEKIRSIYFSEK